MNQKIDCNNAITPPRKKRQVSGQLLRDSDKVEFIPIKVESQQQVLRKPSWIRIRSSAQPTKVKNIKSVLRSHKLASVCEEANCPNLTECFTKGTATFMIMGEICTRRCPFCDVGHGKPLPLDEQEPINLAKAIKQMGLSYVVITSVDRDDLTDGGALHFVQCVEAIKELTPRIRIEVLTPDFRGRLDTALQILKNSSLDVFNHNLETVPSLYRQVRPGANYQHSLRLLKHYKQLRPQVLTKSGIMLGLGETIDQVVAVLKDLRQHRVDMLTLGQYLQPSKHHLAVKKYYHPTEFSELKTIAESLGFSHVASGPLVRSSYHADAQADGKLIT